MDAGEVIGWSAVVWLLCVPIVFWVVGLATRRKGREGTLTGAGMMGIDQVFQPTAYEAHVEWEAQQELPAPAPTPDTGPGLIEGGRRITIVVD